MIELITWGDRTIAVDIVGPVDHESTASLTEYPVEDGSLLADHKIIGARTLELEIKQTETPIDDPQFSMTERSYSWKALTEDSQTYKLTIEKVRTQILSLFLLAGGAVRTLLAQEPKDFTALKLGSEKESGFTMQVLQTANPRDRGAELDALLQELHDSPETCTITYRGRSIPDMSLIGLGRNWTQAGLTSWNCSFKQLRTASIARVDLVDPATLALKAKKSDGKKGDATDPNAAKGDTKSESIAYRLTHKR